jgi:hypothetical protein
MTEFCELPVRLAGMVFAAMLVAGPATVWAGEDGFTSPLIIAAAEFEASGVQTMGTLDRFSTTYGFVTGSVDDRTCVMAPVYLPNGVTITRFEAATADLVAQNPGSSATCPRFYYDVEVDLLSNYMDDNLYPQDTQVTTHASVTSTLNTGQMHVSADVTIVDPVVDNLQRLYWVRVSLCGPFHAFQGVRVHYEE